MNKFLFPADTHSMYIHWPFCPYRCHFCPFVALAGHDQFMGRYHKALCQEIDAFKHEGMGKLALDTIYLGGGTPSTYPNELLLDMFGTLRKNFNFDHKSEVTIEVNPGTVAKGQVTFWRDIGINRISIGVQSLKDPVLKKLNRHQSAQDVYALLEQACDIMPIISVDLILGLPDVNEDEWKSYLKTIVSWPIKHLSMYFLTVHENTQLYFGVKTKKVVLPCEDYMIDLYYWSIDFLKQ